MWLIYTFICTSVSHASNGGVHNTTHEIIGSSSNNDALLFIFTAPFSSPSAHCIKGFRVGNRGFFLRRPCFSPVALPIYLFKPDLHLLKKDTSRVTAISSSLQTFISAKNSIPHHVFSEVGLISLSFFFFDESPSPLDPGA